MKHAGTAALAVLSKGVMDCPDCTVQREARLKAELKMGAAQAFATQACWDKRDVRVERWGQTWSERYAEIFGVDLMSYVESQRSNGK